MKSMMSGKTRGDRAGVLLLLASSAGAALLLSGCGAPAKVTSAPAAAAKGAVQGGQQPVAGVTLQLYTANTSILGPTGYGSLANPFGPQPTATTNQNGGFNFPSLPACPSSNSEVFLVGTGGTPSTGQANPNLAMMVGLGPCQALVNAIAVPTYHVVMNELTTVATVWSLSPFMSGPTIASPGCTAFTCIGAPSTNTTGLANAFASINEIVNTATGTVYNQTTSQFTGPALAPGASFNYQEINSLANILQYCINSVRSVPTTVSTECRTLFTDTATSTTPTDTITAALNIAQHPSVNAGTLYGLPIPNEQTFLPHLTASPTDWTVAINYTGGALSSSAPQSIAVDGNGNVWVTNKPASGTGSVIELAINNAATTTPLYTPTTFTASGNLNAPYGIAIDQNGYPFVTNSVGNTITKLNLDGSFNTQISDPGLNTPEGIAIDGAGNVWAVNNGNSTISGFSNTGTKLTGTPISSTQLNGPASIAVNPK
jgi:hypothetical protein